MFCWGKEQKKYKFSYVWKPISGTITVYIDCIL